MVYLVGVAAALGLALGYVLQQRAASRALGADQLSFRLVASLVRAPVWWVGIGCMVAGETLGGLALQLASVALVEPLLSTSLLFAFVIAAALSDQRVRWQEVTGALVLSAALGVFIAVGNPHSSPSPSPSTAVTVLAVCVLVGVVAVLVVVGKGRGAVAEAILLATAAGLLYGMQDAATRATLLVADHHGVAAVLHNPWVYILVGAAAAGIVIAQSAFRSARLDYSLPPIAAAEPVAGIGLGVSLLGDVVSVSVVGLAAEAACLVAMVVGVALIGRSRSLADYVPSQPTGQDP